VNCWKTLKLSSPQRSWKRQAWRIKKKKDWAISSQAPVAKAWRRFND